VNNLIYFGITVIKWMMKGREDLIRKDLSPISSLEIYKQKYTNM